MHPDAKVFKVSIALIALVLLPTCGPVSTTVKRRTCDAETLLCEARLVDVAFPLNVKIKALEHHPKNTSAAVNQSVWFETTLKTEALISFYKTQMERLGWKQGPILWTIDERATLIFEKPSRLGLVLIDQRPSNHTLVTCSVVCR